MRASEADLRHLTRHARLVSRCSCVLPGKVGSEHVEWQKSDSWPWYSKLQFVKRETNLRVLYTVRDGIKTWSHRYPAMWLSFAARAYRPLLPHHLLPCHNPRPGGAGPWTSRGAKEKKEPQLWVHPSRTETRVCVMKEGGGFSGNWESGRTSGFSFLLVLFWFLFCSFWDEYSVVVGTALPFAPGPQ